MELIFSIVEEGVGLHTICNRLRKAKVKKPSFYKKEHEKSAIEDREQLSSIEQFAEQISGY